jgi:hypothetical protein
LRLWQVPGQLQRRGAELADSRERELHLRLHTERSSDPEAAGPLGEILEEGCLAHAGLAVQDQGAPATGAAASSRPSRMEYSSLRPNNT